MQSLPPDFPENSMDVFVAEYLKSKGYLKTLAEMDSEAKSLYRNEPELHKDKAMSAALGRAYEESYSSFKTWVFSSIDPYRTELQYLCFPVFVAW